VSAPVDFSNIERFVNQAVDDFRLQFPELLQDMWNMKLMIMNELRPLTVELRIPVQRI
jgi:hypothetical protein